MLTKGIDNLWSEAKVQDITNAVIAMERRGFVLDVDFCNAKAAEAREDERKALNRLWELYYDCTGQQPDHWAEQIDVDAIWSSPKQLQALVHGELGMPRSPVWKKGKVKDGEVKLDEVALEWIRARLKSQGRATWSEETVERYRDLLQGIINLRRVRGCLKYLTKLPTYVGPDGRVHPVCGPAGDDDDRVGAVTGRLAVKNPEGQQIPRNKKKDRYRIRRAFIAPPGRRLVVADYSALEVVIMAHICLHLFGDDQLARMVAVGAPDIHSTNARKVFGELLGWSTEEAAKIIGCKVPPGAPEYVRDFELGMFKCPHKPECKECPSENAVGKGLRDLIKAIWYGLMYGKGAYGFGASLTDGNGNPIGEEKAGEIVEGLLDAVPAVRKYQAWVRVFIKQHGGIPSLAGRWCPLADLLREGTRWAEDRAWRRALNYPMQAGGADIVGAAMVLIEADDLLRELGFGVILQIHDELILEGPEENADAALERVMYLMTHCFKLLVPLQVSGHHGKNWDEAK